MTGCTFAKVFRSVFVLVVTAMLIWSAQAFANTTLTFALQYGLNSPIGIGLVAALEAYKARNPDIEVQIIPDVNPPQEKLALLVATGNAPDVANIGTMEVLPLGLGGVLQPIDGDIQRAAFAIDQLLPAAVGQAQWKGETYAVPWTLDLNFRLARSRMLLATAGVDPEVEIRYVSDLDELNKKLTIVEGDGTVRQIGYAPYHAHDFTTWARAFGGSFYDEERQIFTASDPRIREALEWLLSIHEVFGLPIEQMNMVSQRYKDGDFAAFTWAYPSNVSNWRNLNPDLDLKLTDWPHKEDGGHRNAVWVSGPMLGIPRGAKHVDEAMKLIHYLTLDPEGTTVFSKACGCIPASRSPVLEEFRSDPVLGSFIDVVDDARFARPAVPIQRTWQDSMNALWRRVMNGLEPAASALAESDRLLQLELEPYLN